MTTTPSTMPTNEDEAVQVIRLSLSSALDALTLLLNEGDMRRQPYLLDDEEDYAHAASSQIAWLTHRLTSEFLPTPDNPTPNLTEIRRIAYLDHTTALDDDAASRFLHGFADHHTWLSELMDANNRF